MAMMPSPVFLFFPFKWNIKLQTLAQSRFVMGSLYSIEHFVTLQQEVMSSRERFVKDPSIYKQTAAYGPQLVASEGLEWKRFRKASAPAFGEVCIPELSLSLSTIDLIRVSKPSGWRGTKRHPWQNRCLHLGVDTNHLVYHMLLII